jgi:signal transduction histidine kinase
MESVAMQWSGVIPTESSSANLQPVAAGHPAHPGQLLEKLPAIKRMPRLRNDFLATLAHDLRASIGNVLGFAELLGKQLEATTPEARRLLDRLTANAEYLRTVLDGTLASAWKSDRHQAPELLMLEELFVATAERNGFLAGQKHVSLHLDVSPEMRVAAERMPVERILDNLVANAIKVSPRDTRVTIGATRVESRIRLWVADQGGGLPAAHNGKLASLTHWPRPTNPGGHGLGLRIVMKLARQLGGTAGVLSSPGRGATFWVELPTGLDVSRRPV